MLRHAVVPLTDLGLRQVRNLPAFLGLQVERHRWPRHAPSDAVWLGWGRKRSGRRAERCSERFGGAVWHLEDGFLRSVEPGKRSAPLSIVIDPEGIYYDATAPSRLEALVARPHTAAEQERARCIVESWRAARVSKYNHARELAPPVRGRYVLVVDQTAGDASIRYGMASAASFHRMLEAALDEHPGLPVVLKVHPEVVNGRKQGHYGALSRAARSRVTVMGSDAHPPALLEAAHAVYTVTSQMGFEALMWGKPVRTFGMPFYAGWGLTADDLPAPERRRPGAPVGVHDLVHAALVEYPRYVDPETGQRCEAERAIEWMALQRRMRERFPARVYALGFSPWKRPIVESYFAGSTVTFVRTEAQVPAEATLAVWGRREVACARDVVRLEDGFLRSVGLGADLVRPLSWVMDRTGLYYDATAPSDLETLLNGAAFDPALLQRAAALRQQLVSLGVTKYNLTGRPWVRPAGASRVVLVPGQVESDASIAYGTQGAVRTNMALLHAVRAAEPQAYVVYKPHPDVVAGLRTPGHEEATAAQHCDEVVVDVPMDQLLQQVDAVHVLTSLTGFEALLRGRPVTCHGSPFYAGWGLTHDRCGQARRTRRLTLDELVAGVLLLYPTYVSRVTDAFTTAERALVELEQWKAAGPSRLPWWRRALRLGLRWRRR